MGADAGADAVRNQFLLDLSLVRIPAQAREFTETFALNDDPHGSPLTFHSDTPADLKLRNFYFQASSVSSRAYTMPTPDPNMVSWSQYLQSTQSSPSDSEEDPDFLDDSLNNADWDGQSKDFTKQYNRQKTIIQNQEKGISPSQGPKRNTQTGAPAYTSSGRGGYDDTVESLARYAGKINLKNDSK